MTHEELCERARHWLSGTFRCKPVYSRLASCSEIPDAIGWTSKYEIRGSIVVECKTSATDFYADKKKNRYWKHPRWGYNVRRQNIPDEQLLAEGFLPVVMPRMGNFRYFLSSPYIVTAEMVGKHAVDHGLAWVEGRRVKIVVPAPRREDVDQDSEIRYLRFAILNQKQPYERTANEEASTTVGRSEAGADLGRLGSAIPAEDREHSGR